MSTAAYWVWFGIAWLFVAAVLLSRWYAREHREQEATEKALKNTRYDTSGEHIFDA